jgi:hypothetical protein
LYRLTGHNQSPPGLKNRKRIWTLIEYIVQLINLRSSDDDELAIPLNNLPDNESTTVMATADIQRSDAPFFPHSVVQVRGPIKEGCQALWTRCASVPADLTAICVSFFGLEDHGYISGLCFESKSGADSQLGYYSKDSMVRFKVNHLNGFVLAIDSRGIRALQVVDGNGDRSRWAGVPKRAPVTERLHAIDSTEPIRVSIDVS